MTEYKVADGIASTPKGQQLYDQAVAQQNARSLTNLGHRVQLSTSAKKNIAGVSNRPTKAPTTGKFSQNATQQHLIERGFPTVDGIVTPVTAQQMETRGFSSDGKGKDYVYFWNYEGVAQSKNTTQAVLDRQEIYRKITGKPTFAFHGCKNGMCPTWSRHGYLTSHILTKYDTSRGKLNNAPVETSATMFEGIHRRFLPKAEIIPSPIPEPEIIEETQTTDYPIAIIMGILAVVIIIILRGKKNA